MQPYVFPKFRPEKEDQCNVVYKIPCSTCTWSYIGKTERSFNTGKKEHIRNVKMHTKGYNVGNHARSENHQIHVGNALLIDKANFRHLKTQKLLKLTITHAHSPISITFFLANTSFHTFSFLTLHPFAFIISLLSMFILQSCFFSIV